MTESVPASPVSVAILGLGNVLMGDDAFGPYVVASLQARYDFPEGVDLVDVGTPGHELSVYLDGRDVLIVVDAVRAAGEPGEIRSYTGDQVIERPPALVTSPHEPGLRDALLKLAFCGRAPRRLLLVGVIPSGIELGAGLSEPVSRAVHAAEDAIIEALAGFGIVLRQKKNVTPPLIWWE